jgi:hypothetical protein
MNCPSTLKQSLGFGGLRTGKSRRTPTRGSLNLEQLETRLVPYSVSGNAWPSPQLITISFVPDGTVVSTSGTSYVTSNLFATFNAKFGSAAAWQNIILKAAQSWAQQTNINFAVVPDDGSSSGAGSYQQGDPAKGDIRISGFNFNNTNLATAYMPPPANNYSVAGDIKFNTGQYFNNGSTYDLFSVAAHEIGHALGLYHTTTTSAVMYSAYNGVKNALNADDIAGIRAIYSNGNPRTGDGDTNNSIATATDLTLQINRLNQTALVTGQDITTTSDTDYYTFLAPLLTSSTLRVNVQSSGLSLLSPKLTVYAADGTTVLGSAGTTGQYGTTLSVTVGNVTPLERFYIKVAGADATAFGTGAYALTLNFGTGPSPAVPLPNTTLANGNPTSGGGQATKAGVEALVNTYTTGTQQLPSYNQHPVAMDANGNYVITWASQNQDGNGYGVYAQRFNAQGVPQGQEFRANTTTNQDQMYSTVAMDAGGDFVITWSSQNQDGQGWGVYGQRYNAQGVAQGQEFRINTTTANDQMYSSVAMDSVGNFVVVWASNNQDGNGWGVYGQRYAADGTPLGGEFRVNTTTQSDQNYPTIAMNGTGAFVVVWASHGQDGNGWGVYAQRYNAQGVAQGGEFQVNTYTQDDQLYGNAALDAGGNFVVTWASHNQDGSGWGVYAQRFDALGVAQGGEFRVNTTTLGDQNYPTIAMNNTGSFLITWSSFNPLNGGSQGIVGQQYAAGGSPIGGEFQINSSIAITQNHPSVAMDGTGQAVVAWSGNGTGDSDGVFMQRFDLLDSNLEPGAVNDIFDPNEIFDPTRPGGGNCPCCGKNPCGCPARVAPQSPAAAASDAPPLPSGFGPLDVGPQPVAPAAAGYTPPSTSRFDNGLLVRQLQTDPTLPQLTPTAGAGNFADSIVLGAVSAAPLNPGAAGIGRAPLGFNAPAMNSTTVPADDHPSELWDSPSPQAEPVPAVANATPLEQDATGSAETPARIPAVPAPPESQFDGVGPGRADAQSRCVPGDQCFADSRWLEDLRGDDRVGPSDWEDSGTERVPGLAAASLAAVGAFYFLLPPPPATIVEESPPARR